MYRAETWALRKVKERTLGVAEMGMLRWMYGVIKLDRISNERVRGTKVIIIFIYIAP